MQSLLVVTLEVAACILLVIAAPRIAKLMIGGAARLLERLSPTRMLSVSWILRLMIGVEWRLLDLIFRANAYRSLGRMDEAVATVREVLSVLDRKRCPWGLVNQAVDIYVSAGLYRDALRVPRAWSKEARKLGRAHDPVAFTLTRINQAEALHNLGRDDSALRRLDKVEPLARKNELALHGLRLLRAWILTHRGELERARDELGRVDENALRDYRAEVRYTWAALERESGHLERAREHAEAGLGHARRPSSVRNGKFMLGAILGLLGDAEQARARFEEAVASDYRGQGADGLWRYATFLGAEGDPVAVGRVLDLLVERDPESAYAARTARAGAGSTS